MSHIQCVLGENGPVNRTLYSRLLFVPRPLATSQNIRCWATPLRCSCCKSLWKWLVPRRPWTLVRRTFNSLVPVRYGCNLKLIFFKFIWRISCQLPSGECHKIGRHKTVFVNTISYLYVYVCFEMSLLSKMYAEPTGGWTCVFTTLQGKRCLHHHSRRLFESTFVVKHRIRTATGVGELVLTH